MGPRSTSSSMAFEPTPAIYSPVDKNTDRSDGANSVNHGPALGRRSIKEVSFGSATLGPRAQSIATSIPRLEPITSASQMPRQNGLAFRFKNFPSVIDMEDYIEQSRLLLENQRLNFARERDQFDDERYLWRMERANLLEKIRKLESGRNKRRSSHDPISNDLPSFEKSFRVGFGSSSTRASRDTSVNSSRPVWEMPTSHTPLTRAFPTDSPPSLLKQPIPQSNGSSSIPGRSIERATRPVPVPVFDSSLDGITFKAGALESSFVKLHSPTHASASSDQPLIQAQTQTNNNNGPVIQVDEVLSPTDANLIRHAGHTPMLLSRENAGGEAVSTAESPTISPTAEPSGQSRDSEPPRSSPGRPPARPSERSDSYFSPTADSIECSEQPPTQASRGNDSPDGDVELKGPLVLSNTHEEGRRNGFLESLDDSLLAEVRRIQTGETLSVAKTVKQNDASTLDDGLPALRLKKSMNFGSAYGSSNCGNIK